MEWDELAYKVDLIVDDLTDNDGNSTCFDYWCGVSVQKSDCGKF